MVKKLMPKMLRLPEHLHLQIGLIIIDTWPMVSISSQDAYISIKISLEFIQGIQLTIFQRWFR